MIDFLKIVSINILIFDLVYMPSVEGMLKD